MNYESKSSANIEIRKIKGRKSESESAPFRHGLQAIIVSSATKTRTHIRRREKKSRIMKVAEHSVEE